MMMKTNMRGDFGAKYAMHKQMAYKTKMRCCVRVRVLPSPCETTVNHISRDEMKDDHSNREQANHFCSEHLHEHFTAFDFHRIADRTDLAARGSRMQT